MVIEVQKIEPRGEDHRLRSLERQVEEVFRRLAIYEKRILISEGEREADRPDDEKEWGELLRREPAEARADAVAVAEADDTAEIARVDREAEVLARRRAAATERQRRRREKVKGGKGVST